MLQTPTKRISSGSPDHDRPPKRQATSSPEEGELDDASPPPPRPINPLPPKPAFPPKVKFPFKKKTSEGEVSSTVTNALAVEKKNPVIYERSEEDERRIRETQAQWMPKPRISHEQPRWRGAPSGADHWEPSRGHNRDRDRNRPSNWDTRGRDNDRNRPWPARDRQADRYVPGDKERGRSPPSSASLDRSRSSSPSSSHRGKHRLPSRRSPAIDFTPPPRDYGVDRLRDEQMRDWEWDRQQYDSYSRNDNHYHSREREAPDGRHADNDRHYRPGRDTRQRSPRRDRSRDSHSRRIRYDDDRGSYRTNDYPPISPRMHESDRDSYRMDDYRPVSPGPSTLPSRPPTLPPQSPTTHISFVGPKTPPLPPPTSPPPAPSEPIKNDTLPTEHATISISIPMKRPAAPRDDHSPPSLPLPPAHDDAAKHNKAKKDSAVDATPVPHNYVPAQRRKREPVQRTRDEEKEIYGRVFEGCGKQSDYDATTKLGEGTFGEVHKAVQLATGRSVALKRILMHNEKEGMPVTALREIKILKAMQHPCVVDILDMFVVRSKGKDSPLSVYMVFPYMDHDLAGLLENERAKLQPSHIKLYMKQLLEGTEYMHRNHILHRDMKAANLLISNSGSLRIADFGLARAFDPNIVRGVDSLGKERKYTNCVVTRWYRPPELLLGARQYGGEVDIWGIGCVLGEMFMRKPILPGISDLDQLEKIWQLCGTPNQHTWPNYDTLPGCEGIKRFSNLPKRLKTAYDSIGPETCDLLDKLLTCNPRERITASQALDHDYFWTDPLPADPKSLPSYEASHEFDRRGRRNQPPPGLPPEGYYRQQYHGPPPPIHLRGAPPPPREMFRQGPPPAPGMYMPVPPAPGYPPYPPNHPRPGPYNNAGPNRMPYAPPYGGPRQPGPGFHDRRPGPAHPAPPPHLPQRPLVPFGDQPPRYRDRNPRHGGYGGRDRNGGELPYS